MIKNDQETNPWSSRAPTAAAATRAELAEAGGTQGTLCLTPGCMGCPTPAAQRKTEEPGPVWGLSSPPEPRLCSELLRKAAAKPPSSCFFGVFFPTTLEIVCNIRTEHFDTQKEDMWQTQVRRDGLLMGRRGPEPESHFISFCPFFTQLQALALVHSGTHCSSQLSATGKCH